MSGDNNGVRYLQDVDSRECFWPCSLCIDEMMFGHRHMHASLDRHRISLQRGFISTRCSTILCWTICLAGMIFACNDTNSHILHSFTTTILKHQRLLNTNVRLLPHVSPFIRIISDYSEFAAKPRSYHRRARSTVSLSREHISSFVPVFPVPCRLCLCQLTQ